MARTSGHPRWRDPGLLVMGSLSGGPKHGYTISRDIHETFGVALGPGTLYGALARLEERGLIEPLGGDERRRPYRLTASGSAVLADQAAAMNRFADTARVRLDQECPGLGAMKPTVR